MIFRKLLKNKWMELGLLSGIVLTVAMVSTMPIYTDAIMQRMLVKELGNRQMQTQQYPSTYWSAAYLKEEAPEHHQEIVRAIDQLMAERALPTFGLPILEHVRERVTESYRLQPVHPERVDGSVRRYAQIGALSDVEDHVRLVDGRFPANEPIDGVYEALVPERALVDLRMVLGHEFLVESEERAEPLKIKPVGVFDKKTHDDVYWYAKNISNYSRTFLIPFDLFERDITGKRLLKLDSSYWYSVVDYADMRLEHVQRFFDARTQIERGISQQVDQYAIHVPVLQTLAGYSEQEQRLRTLLWSLQVPILIMLAYYLFMVSNLIVERQKQEIAVLKSRGSGRLQIMLMYLIEGILLGAAAMAVGPWIALWLTKVLGASSGFLELVQRSGLHARLDATTYKYASIVTVCSLVMMLIPVYFASGTSIVAHKQKAADGNKPSWLYKYFIDFVLLGIAYYGWSGFQSKMKELGQAGGNGGSAQIDPLTFLVPTLFILGTGLLLLRIYPWVLKLLFWLGQTWWSPALYATIIQVGRSGRQYQFLMIFLVMTIATGMFSASAARTINRNMEDVIYYKNGSDMVLSLQWEDNINWFAIASGEEELSNEERIQYSEPLFQPILELPGVESAAKVFTKVNVDFTSRTFNGRATLMGVETDEFGRTAWFRNGLLDHHINDYLNLIARDPSAVLISRKLAEDNGIRAGDTVNVSWRRVEPASFTVYGIIDYFPSFLPNSGSGSDDPMLIIGHLETIQNRLALEPYDVWLKLKPEASRSDLYEAFEAKGLRITELRDSVEEVVTGRNDPFHLAINGVMTLGFLIAVVICFLGFLLYWVLLLFSRVLQTGIFRAMGISFRQILGMLFMEQILTSGAAIAIGMGIGWMTSVLFVPHFQLSFHPATQVPPFQVILNPNDTLRLFVVVGCMIMAGLFILGKMMARIKIHQAVKLGEDQ
jgi:putative ABC transport system permease protein